MTALDIKSPAVASLLAHEVAIRAYWTAIRNGQDQARAKLAYDDAYFDKLKSIDSTAPGLVEDGQ